MATPRYRRVNIDGQSLYKTETHTCEAALLPGTFVTLNDDADQWRQALAADAQSRIYVMGVANDQGLNIMDAVPAGDSGVGNYVEDSREFAIRFAASTALVKDQPITIGAGGLGVAAVIGTDVVVGFSAETVTLPAGAQDFIRVRMAQRAIS